MRVFVKIGIVLGVATLVASCHNKSTPNYQYMPNMYEPVSYETYQETGAFRNGKEGQLPVEGTIARGHMPYEYPNTLEGHDLAKANLKNPLPFEAYRNADSTVTDEYLKKGEELFNIYCAVCHGTKGNGKGVLVDREKILGVPSYDDAGRAITEGSVYHVIRYGLNAMGSYANQLNEQERWEVTEYVMKLKQDLENK
ncbi:MULTISPECIES: c-type cytochrome [Galbibacter]|uniref:Cytochrome c n=1 Tax=Galbibacter pacificus TaxID=2996052 RepID=A0ABT6FTW6_9FLAO|nr:cytochrome c [Galbibacter pacificus]MDG3583071.1 cytochrome c [Galbibacter pacificus]MDG3586552.1 cytochrome c [Galbibacter pacificus]